MKLIYVGSTKLQLETESCWREVEVWKSSRGGTMSPIFILYKYKNRWITPLERKIKKWPSLSVAITLRIFYTDAKEDMKDLVYKENPFLKLISKDSTWNGSYISVPIKI